MASSRVTFIFNFAFIIWLWILNIYVSITYPVEATESARAILIWFYSGDLINTDCFLLYVLSVINRTEYDSIDSGANQTVA